MKPCELPDGGITRSSSFTAYPPAAQLDEKLAWPLLIARSDPMADASLPAIRARRAPENVTSGFSRCVQHCSSDAPEAALGRFVWSLVVRAGRRGWSALGPCSAKPFRRVSFVRLTVESFGCKRHGRW